jgi:hypothetical protein
MSRLRGSTALVSGATVLLRARRLLAGGSVADGSITTAKLGGDITAAGKALLDDANAAAQRTTLALGYMWKRTA